MSLRGEDALILTQDYVDETLRGAGALRGEKGDDGKSAYQYAQDGGYIGTETEFTTNIARSGVISKELEVERARIDNLTTLQDGSTTGDAELIDARIDKDGNTHVNVGEHIRTVSSQLSSENAELKSDIDYISDEVKDLTGIDANELKWFDGYFDYNGNISKGTAGSCKYSEKIFLKKNETIRVKCSGYEKVLTVIGILNKVNSTVAPVVRDNGTFVDYYAYTAEKDCFIVLSYYYGNGEGIKIKITKKLVDIDTDYDRKNVDKSLCISTNVYTTTGFHSYDDWYSTEFLELKYFKKFVYLQLPTFIGIYMIAFFDKDKNFLSGILPDSSNASVLTFISDFNIPSDAVYFRISSVINSTTLMGEFAYVPNSSAYENIKSVDMTNRFENAEYYKDGSTHKEKAWATTDFIDLSNVSEIRKLKTIGHTLVDTLVLFDDSKKVIREFVAPVNNVEYTLNNIVLMPNEKYAKVSWGEVSINGKLAQSNDVVFELVLKTPEINKTEDYSYLVRQFTNILCIGDSLTEGDYGSYPEGSANVHSKNYPYFMGKILNVNVTNKGFYGTYPTWWWTHKDRIDTSIPYDCIFFFLGTNFGLTDTIESDTSAYSYENYADTETGRYCSMLEWLKEKIPTAKIFLISFPHNYRPIDWFTKNNAILKKIANKYNLPVVDMTVNVPFSKYNGNIYRPVGYDASGTNDKQLYGNLHFGKLGYLTFAEYLIRNTGDVIHKNMIEYAND